MKTLLFTLGSWVILSGTALAKPTKAGGCAQAVSDTAVNTLRGTGVILGVAILGVYVLANLFANRRRDKELQQKQRVTA